MIEIRPAKMSDKEIISKISRYSWDNSEEEFEYIPSVFEKWLNDPGEFVVALYNSEIVGCAKLTLLSNNIAWLEGLRVDYNKQGLGIGKALQNYFLNKRNNYDAMQLSTFIENHASLHIINKYGFKKRASFRILETKIDSLSLVNSNVKTVKCFDEVKDFLEEKQLKVSDFFIGFEWVFKRLDYNLIKYLTAKDCIKAIYSNNKINSIMILSSDYCKEGLYSINYLQGNNEELISLVNYAKNFVYKKGGSSVIFMCPEIKPYRKLLMDNGFYSYSDDDNNVFVYEHNQERGTNHESLSTK